MNALVGVRSISGLFSANAAQRASAKEQVYSLTRAGFRGRSKMVAAAQGKSAGAPTHKAGETNKASETEDGTTTREIQNDLDKDSFLQLLVSQMQNQDPMNPADNSAMLAQLAQFSSLEQMNNLNESFATVSGNIDQLNFINANGLIGKEITGVDVEGNAIVGTVSRVHMDGSLVYLTVGDKLVSMAGVMAIGNAPATAGE